MTDEMPRYEYSWRPEDVTVMHSDGTIVLGTALREALAKDPWWAIRGHAVHLKRLPRPGESLPSVAVVRLPVNRVGGGLILPVYGPNGELLSYGRTTE